MAKKQNPGRDPQQDSIVAPFLCSVCRRYRTEARHSEPLPCCASQFVICNEKCAEMIPQTCRGMSVEQYAAFYRRVHQITCPKKFRM